MLRILLLLALTSITAHAHAHAVRWSDIKGWHAVGSRWAEALDADGTPIALYDLSYPTFFDVVRLGRIGTGDPKLFARAMEQLQAAKETADVSESRDADAAIVALASLKAHDARLPEGWWKQVPWKKEPARTREGAPVRFLLADVDFSRAVSQPRAFRRHVNAAELREHDGERLLPNGLLASLELVRQDDGSYEIFWAGGGIDTRPTKLADFVSVRDALWRSFAWSAVEQGLSSAAGLITIPVVQGLLKTALSRFFLYRRELARQHEAMVLEMVNAAENAEDFAPFSSFSEKERALSGESMLLADTTLIGIIPWLWKKPEREWRKGLDKELADASKALAWVEWREFVDILNPRNAFGRDEGGRQRLYTLARPRFFGLGRPHVALDSASPQGARLERVLIETVSIAVEFATDFIPWIGGTVYSAYSRLVETPMRTDVRWEARLSSHLEQRGGFERELGLLDSQRINPFELPRARELALVERRRKELGLNPL